MLVHDLGTATVLHVHAPWNREESKSALICPAAPVYFSCTPNRLIPTQRHKPCAQSPCSCPLSCTKLCVRQYRCSWTDQAIVTVLWKALIICHRDFKLLLQLHLVGFDQQSWDFIHHNWSATPLMALDRSPVSLLLSYSPFSEGCSTSEWASLLGTATHACRD